MDRKKKMRIHQIKQALLEIFAGTSHHEVARRIDVPASTVDFWATRSETLKLTAAKVIPMDEEELAATFLQKPGPKEQSHRPIVWEVVGGVLQKSTLEEAYLVYCNSMGDSELPLLTQSGFTKRVKKWRKALESARRDMAQQWPAGDYVLIDYSGDKVTIIGKDGEKITVRFFLAVFPFSGLVFWFATPDATTHSWLTAIVEMFKYIGKVPNYIKHDNDVALINRAEWGTKECKKQFKAMCRHYQMANSPCRVYHPKDKALAENEVGNLNRIFIHSIDPETFKSIPEINAQLRVEMENYNNSIMEKRGISRSNLFVYEKPHLREIPNGHYVVDFPMVKRKVGQNGCVGFETHDYMMPNEYYGKTVKVGVGEDGLLHFKDTKGKPICTYPHFQYGVPDEVECFLHIKPEFRMEWEVTPEKRLEKACGSFRELSPNAGDYIDRFMAKNRREEKGTLATKIRAIEKKIAGAPKDVIEKSIRHVMEIGSLDPESLVACVKFYGDENKFYEDKGDSRSSGLGGACLRSLSDLLGHKKGRTIQ